MLYPVQTESRLVSDLSGLWSFRLDNDGEGFSEEWYKGNLEDAVTMPVPASYNDLREGADFRDHYGWVFYQRHIAIPKYISQSQRVVLRCDAVTHHAIIWLNGTKLAEHYGGFLPFEAELNGALTDGDNLLTIAVDNRIDYTTLPVGGKSGMLSTSVSGLRYKSTRKQNHPNFDFFNYCGITRPVRIYTTPKSYIHDVTITADVADLSAQAGPLASSVHAVLKVTADFKGEGLTTCRIDILDAKGVNVASCVVPVKDFRACAELAIDNATLWQPLKSYLYTVRVTLEGHDVYTLPYGIRTIKVDGTKFLINGRAFYFKGYGKHEDSFPAGRGMNLPLNVKDFAIMRWQGANSFRTSHYPYSEEIMRLADAEGFVVIDETTAVGLNFDFGGGANFNGQKVKTFDPEHGVKTFAHHQEVIRDLIARDKNYACVVMWSIANEPDSYNEGAYEYFAPLFALARELDPQKRPCTLASVAMAGGPDRDISAKLSDVICLNRYYGWYVGAPELDGPEELLRAELKEWATTGKPIMFTEYGADTVAGFHDTTPVMYTEEYQLDYYKMNNRVFDEFECVMGEQVWNFADFATSQGMLRVQGNKKGLFTRDRKPKLAAHYFRERWHKIPDFDYRKTSCQSE